MKISIITATYNNAAGLLITLESLKKQTDRSYEVIVVDGGSSDNTAEIAGQYKDTVTVFISEPDKGIYDAQNKGILKSTGEYLLFLNAGDVLYDSNVIKIFLSLQNGEDLIYGNIVLQESSGTMVQLKYPDHIGYRYWYKEKYLCHQAVFFGKKLFEEYGLYNTKYRLAADFDFLQRVWFKPNTVKKHLDFTVSLYDLGGASASPENRDSIIRDYKEIRRKHHPLSVNLMFSFIYDVPAVHRFFRSAARLVFRIRGLRQ